MAAAVPSRMLPDGLELARDAITPEQEARLIEACARCYLAYYEQDPGNPRSRKSFGWEYDIAGDRFSLGDPVPEAFHGVRALAAEFSGVAERDIVDCMVIHYEPGALIQPHYDKPVFDQIVGLQFGIEEIPPVFLGNLQRILKGMMIEAQYDIGVHLDEPAIAVPRKARIAR